MWVEEIARHLADGDEDWEEGVKAQIEVRTQSTRSQ